MRKKYPHDLFQSRTHDALAWHLQERAELNQAQRGEGRGMSFLAVGQLTVPTIQSGTLFLNWSLMATLALGNMDLNVMGNLSGGEGSLFWLV